MQVNGLWYVLSARSEWEHSTQIALRAKGYEVLLALTNNSVLERTTNKLGETPIFSGYLFLRF